MKFIKKIFMLNLMLFILLTTACSQQPDMPADAFDPDAAADITDNGLAKQEDFYESDESDDSNDFDDSDGIGAEDIEIADAETPLSDGAEDTGIGESDESIIKKDGFIFIYNGTTVYLGEYSERVLEELGDARECIEGDSCTSDGIMIKYYYNGFDFSTYVKEETQRERIFSITLTDDTVTTAEGIYIGQTVADMTAVYGTEYEEFVGFYYRYTKGGIGLSFDVDGDIITAITYTLLNINE